VETGATRDLSTYWRQAPARHPRGHEKYPDGAPDTGRDFG